MGLNELLPTGGAAHGKADEFVCIGIEIPFVALRQQLCIACDHAERLLQVVRSHIRELFELRVGPSQLFHLAAQLLLGALLSGDVAYKCGKETPLPPAYGGDSKFYGEFCSVSVQRRDLNPLVQHRTLPGSKKHPKTIIVSFAIAVRNNHLREGLSDGLRTGPPEGALCLRIPICNQAVSIHLNK